MRCCCYVGRGFLCAAVYPGRELLAVAYSDAQPNADPCTDPNSHTSADSGAYAHPDPCPHAYANPGANTYAAS